MSANQCVICTRDVQGAYADKDCITSLTTDLRTLAWLAVELTITRTRQARLGGGARGAGGSSLGYHDGAARAYDALHNCLSGWVRDLNEGYATPWPSDTAESMAAWLAVRGKRLRQHPAVDQLARDVREYTEWARLVINPIPDESTYGVCGVEMPDGRVCDAHLYGEPDANWVRCQRCHTQHNARERTEALRARMSGLYFRASTLARLLPRLLQRPVSDNNIRAWARERPDAIRTERDEDGFPTYHCGDVIEVAASTPKRDRSSKKSA